MSAGGHEAGQGSVAIADLREIGHGLNRPECVLAHASGHLIAADWQGPGGIAIIAPDGTVARVAAEVAGERLRPNGIALETGGSVLLTHLGAETGGVFRLRPGSPRVEPILTGVDGVPLPPTNFVTTDRSGAIWVTVSTRVSPRAKDYRPDAASGFIVRIDGQGARVVVDGLGYTNECLVTPDGRHLLVNETFGRRLTRFGIAADGSLVDRTVLAAFGPGIFPDGLALDEDGGIWIVSVVSNTVLRLSPAGTVRTILDDSDAAHVAWVEAAYRAGRMDRPHMDKAAGQRLRNVSSLAFSGARRRTAVLGNLLGDRLHAFDTAFTGIEPLHWHAPLSPLLQMAAP